MCHLAMLMVKEIGSNASSHYCSSLMRRLTETVYVHYLCTHLQAVCQALELQSGGAKRRRFAIVLLSLQCSLYKCFSYYLFIEHNVFL